MRHAGASRSLLDPILDPILDLILDQIPGRSRRGLPLPRRLLAHSLLLRAQLRRELLAEVLGLEDRPDLDFGPAVERRALEPLDRLVDRLHAPHPVAGDELLGLGERAVGDRPLGAGEAHALAA